MIRYINETICSAIHKRFLKGNETFEAQSMLRLYLASLFQMGILFGFYIGLYKAIINLPYGYLKYGFPAFLFYAVFKGLTHGLIAGTAFGFISSTIAIIVHYFSFKNVLRKFPISKVISYSPRQKRVLQTKNTDPEEILHSAEQILLSMPMIDKQSIKKCEPQGLVEAKTAMGISSYGELISIRVAPVSNSSTQIEVLSIPKKPTCIMDNGKSYENVELISRYLKEQLIDSEDAPGNAGSGNYVSNVQNLQ